MPSLIQRAALGIRAPWRPYPLRDSNYQDISFLQNHLTILKSMDSYDRMISDYELSPGGPEERISGATIHNVATPSLVVDRDVLERNCRRMIDRAEALRVNLRPHLKTAKSEAVARIATAGNCSGITVSTVREAEYFARCGFRDVLYAVGVSLPKMVELERLSERYGCFVSVILDSVDVARAIAHSRTSLSPEMGVLIEIDSGGGRGGIDPSDARLLEIARCCVEAPGCVLRGVLTHAGHSYRAASTSEISTIAEDEHRAAVTAAARLRDAGFSVECVSVGSTPTALFAKSLEGVTEVRAGVYVFNDLDQVTLGACGLEDIALSVLATVIGHNERSERLIIDAGALALSKDLSADKRQSDLGFGLVRDIENAALPVHAYVSDVHQEHGLVAGLCPFEELKRLLPLGSRVRVLPNHACMSAAPFTKYFVTRGPSPIILDSWGKVSGW